MSKLSLDFVPGRERRYTWGRKNEEYMADFILVSRRTLDDFEYRIFKFHFLLGADWKLCCRQMKLDRGRFFHAVYRIEQKLGRVFHELKPYGLYPVEDYFNTVRRDTPGPEPGPVVIAMPPREAKRINVPIKKAA